MQPVGWNGGKMTKNTCISCNAFIVESAVSDPYMCRDCERALEGAEELDRFPYLENY